MQVLQTFSEEVSAFHFNLFSYARCKVNSIVLRVEREQAKRKSRESSLGEREYPGTRAGNQALSRAF